jgi:hypothetical protein
MCKYEWARIFLVKEGLCPKLQYYRTCKFSWEEPKASNSSSKAHEFYYRNVERSAKSSQKFVVDLSTFL